MRSRRGWDLALWMRSSYCGRDLAPSPVVRASGSECRSRNCPRFDPNILRNIRFWGATDEAVLNIVKKKKKQKKLSCSSFNLNLTGTRFHKKTRKKGKKVNTFMSSITWGIHEAQLARGFPLCVKGVASRRRDTPCILWPLPTPCPTLF